MNTQVFHNVLQHLYTSLVRQTPHLKRPCTDNPPIFDTGHTFPSIQARTVHNLASKLSTGLLTPAELDPHTEALAAIWAWFEPHAAPDLVASRPEAIKVLQAWTSSQVGRQWLAANGATARFEQLREQDATTTPAQADAESVPGGAIAKATRAELDNVGYLSTECNHQACHAHSVCLVFSC